MSSVSGAFCHNKKHVQVNYLATALPDDELLLIFLSASSPTGDSWLRIRTLTTRISPHEINVVVGQALTQILEIYHRSHNMLHGLPQREIGKECGHHWLFQIQSSQQQPLTSLQQMCSSGWISVNI
jgi:hypothetical protein